MDCDETGQTLRLYLIFGKSYTHGSLEQLINGDIRIKLGKGNPEFLRALRCYKLPYNRNFLVIDESKPICSS